MEGIEDHKVTPKLKDILAKAIELASAKAVRKTSDEDFMARVEAVCLIRRIYDGLYLDNQELLPKMKRLYPEFARRIDTKGNKQDAQPLVKSFHRFIYGTSFIKQSIGVKKWEEELVGYEAKFGLDPHNQSRFNPQETTGLSIAQLKCRSSESKEMYVEYLSELTKKEFVRINDAVAERQLRRQLKSLNEEIIPDFLNIRISSTMSVPTLRALNAIFTLRSWLSSESHDINDPTYANLQVQRMWQILKALKTKYRRTKTLNNKIEILSFINTLEEDLTCKDSDFAVKEASKLLTKYSGKSSDHDLTPFQSLRLQLITEARGSEFSELATESRANLSELATSLLNSIPNSSFLIPNSPGSSFLIPNLEEAVFELGSLTLIEHRVSPSLREAIFNRFTLLLEASIKVNNTAEISNLLTLFPFWNENSTHRQRIKELTVQLQIPNSSLLIPNSDNSSLSLPVLRVNPIAAEIYSRLDALSGKYTTHTIPA